MKCFYHTDADGECAAYWVANAAHVRGEECEFFPITYGIKFPFESIEKGEEVYIVDYSIEPAEMDRLLSITSKVVWIDHHGTAIAKYTNYPRQIDGLRRDGIAGCMLTYCYLSHMTDQGRGDMVKSFDESMINSAPFFTKLVADYDVWKFEFGDTTRMFHLAFLAYNFDPANYYMWSPLLENVQAFIDAGLAMVKYRDGWAKSYLSLGFECEFEGYDCFAVNLGRCSSEYFKSLPREYDIHIPFVFDGTQWTCSLYSRRVDVSEIAKKYGGGGHKGASGFQVANLPFKKKEGV